MEGALRGDLMQLPQPPDDLVVIETLHLAPDGPRRLARHMARMGRTAEALGIAYDPREARDLLLLRRMDEDQRARLTLDLAGNLLLEVAPLAPAPAVWRVDWAAERIDPLDPWRGAKTSQRGPYDRARAAMAEHLDELLFLNDRDEIVEGAITNVFLDTGEGLLTPPLASGALPGILREELIETGRARETRLTPADLAQGTLYMGNALRGLIRAELIDGA